MDIAFLLFLQDLREAIGGVLDSFFLQMTDYGELSFVLMALAVVYWCVDKRLGQYLLLGWGFNRLVNGFVKITACAYRPWIRDARVQPLADAIPSATGYSFPSGHTTNASTLFGGPAVRRGTSRVLRIVLLLYFPVTKLVELALPGSLSSSIARFLQAFFVLFVVPWLVKRLERQDGKPARHLADTATEGGTPYPG